MSKRPAAPTITEAAPIPGTHLHRRYQAGREVAPEYRGDAINELDAIAEADSLGLSSVMYVGRLYARISGEWYVFNLDKLPEAA